MADNQVAKMGEKLAALSEDAKMLAGSVMGAMGLKSELRSPRPSF